MPYMDGTGPKGFGPMTGRGMGLCISRRYGRSFGRGYRFRRFFSLNDEPLTSEEEKKLLEEEKEEINKRLKELD